MASKYKEELTQRLEEGTIEELKMDDKFSFECSQECMGRCCTRITILLDPWDVEVMARHLGLSGRDFLKQYCDYEFDRQSRWPFVRLHHAAKGPCIFMLEDGRCKIYPARSRNCRTYPIGRAVRFESEGAGTKLVDKLFMVDRAEFCFGHKADKNWTVQEWLEDSNAFKYYELSDLYLELIDYVGRTLNGQEWLNEGTSQMLAPLLFGPDVLRAKLGINEDAVSHEEFYQRRLKAVKAVLTDMAAGFGFGPCAEECKGDEARAMLAGSMMDRMKDILLKG